jgi:uncharacterized protein
MGELADLIGRYAAAWRAGDLAGLRACYHPDFTLHYFGANPLAGEHAGLEAALSTMGEIGRRAERRLLEIQDVLVGERRAAILARERFTRGDLSVEVDRVLVYAAQDGLLRHCWVYDADQALMDRLLA